jgi:hypothetical protein
MSATTARRPGEARRGDLVAIVQTSTDYMIGQPSVERQRVSLAVVTSVTRLGVAKAARTEYGNTLDLTRPDNRRRVLVVPAEAVDVPAVLAGYAERRYPTAPHSTMVPPFDSVEECRTFVAAFRTLNAHHGA